MTNRAAADLHRRMDERQAEAMSRDGGEPVGHAGALMRPRDRRADMATMRKPREPRVLLLTLAERTSGRGTAYLSGWLGRARLVGFRAAEPDARGDPVWEVYAAEPEPRPGREGPEAAAGSPVAGRGRG